MVDVSAKEPTVRTALATGIFRTTAEVTRLLEQGGLPKGDALATARIAGIMAAKRTPDLVPLCHPISISGVTVDLAVGEAEVRISATVRTTDRTGVEMEALTAVAVAGLTLHDMIKAVDPAAVLDAVRVERKDGGKTGTWTRPPDRSGPFASETRASEDAGVPAPSCRRAGSRPVGTGDGASEDRGRAGAECRASRESTRRHRTDDRATIPFGLGAADRGGDHRVHPGGRWCLPGSDRSADPGVADGKRFRGARAAGSGGRTGRRERAARRRRRRSDHHLGRHRDFADRPDTAGDRGDPRLRDPRPGSGDPCGRQRQGADRGAVPGIGRGQRSDPGGQPARFHRRGS